MCLRTRSGTPGRFGTTALIAPSAPYDDVVQPRHVDRAGVGQPHQQTVPAAGPAGHLPVLDQLRDREGRLFAVAQHRGVQEVGDRLGVERGVPAGQDDRVVLVAVDRAQRHPGQVQGVQEVGVAEFGGEADAQHVEGRHRPVRVEGELWHLGGAHPRLEVGPDGVRPLGQDPVPLVQDLVQDGDALVGQPDLVGVRVHQGPADGSGLPVLDDRVEFAPDVLDRLRHRRQQRLQPGEDGRGRTHSIRVVRNPVGRPRR